jgi:hypothetical protein
MSVIQGKGNWTGIEPKLDMIQIMGWSSNSINFTLNGSYDVNYTYTYIESTQRLSINFKNDSTLDMNSDWVIEF